MEQTSQWSNELDVCGCQLRRGYESSSLAFVTMRLQRKRWREGREKTEGSFSNVPVLLCSAVDPGDHVCHSYSYGLRAIIQCLPAWFRFIQCLRRYRDTKRAFPHLVNAGKYSTTFFVVTFAALYATHRGRRGRRCYGERRGPTPSLEMK